MWPSTIFLIMAVILVAPHLSESDGKLIAIVSAALGVAFGAIEWWLIK